MRLGLALLISIVISGCAMQVSREPPATVQRVEAATRYVFDLAPADTVADTHAWWRQLGGAELDGLVRQLQDQSLSIAAAEARVAQARALTRVARAERRPGVSANVDGGGQRGNAFVPGLPGNEPEWNELYRAALNADWDLDIFGAARAAELAASLRAESNVLAAAALRQSLTVELVRGYVNARTLKQQIDLNRAIVDAFERTAELTDQRYRAGSRTASLLDVQIARQNAASAAAAVPSLEAQYRNQLTAIDLLLGRMPGRTRLNFAGLTPVETLVPMSAGEPADVLFQRPDVALADLNWQAARLDLGAARARRLPNLSLAVSFSHQTEDASDLLDLDDWVGSVLAGLFAPIYQGGRLKAEVERAEAVAAELAADFAQTTLNAVADVERALVNEQAAREQLSRRSESLAAAELSDQIATDRYAAGQVTLLTLLETRRALDAARQERILAEQSVLNARADLYFALGGDWFGADADPARAPVENERLDGESSPEQPEEQES